MMFAARTQKTRTSYFIFAGSVFKTPKYFPKCFYWNCDSGVSGFTVPFFCGAKGIFRQKKHREE